MIMRSMHCIALLCNGDDDDQYDDVNHYRNDDVDEVDGDDGDGGDD